MSKSLPITGAEALILTLIDQGVDRVFGYPGGSIMPIYNALFDHTDQLTHILTRHEQGSVHAAQGYARATGKIGVVFTTSGPGATNIVTGIADALADSTPLVAITGQVNNEHLGFDAFQETDVVGVTLPVAKWSFQVRRAADIVPVVSRAFYIASSGRPGPVVVDITLDAQKEMTTFDPPKEWHIRSYTPCPELDGEAVKAAASLINQSSKPMIIAGQGVILSGAESELVAFAEKIGAPVCCTLLGLSAIPSSHPLYKGMVGMHGNVAANVNTNCADLIIAVGMRFDNRVTSNERTYAHNAKVIHIDIDDSEFDKCIFADVKVHADAKQALTALTALTTEAQHDEWLKAFDRPAEIEMEKVTRPELHPTSAQLNMGEVVAKVSEAFGHDAIVVTDVGLNQMMASKYSQYKRPRSLITSGGLGTMGFGLPAAIGAKMGCPDRQVVLFAGDGGLQMTIQELGTIMEHGTAVKIVLLNNHFLGNVRQLQTVFYNSRFSATPLQSPDFVTIARGYGIKGECVSARDDLDAAIQRLAQSDGPYLLNVEIAEADMVFPMIKGGDDVDHIMLNLNEYYQP